MTVGSWCVAKKRVLKDGIYGDWEQISISHNILLNGGRDFLHNQGYITASVGTAVLQYIALSTDAGAPAATDTTLTAEVTTNGLARAQATTDSHSVGTNSTTIAYTWTASGIVNSIQKCALFTAIAAGTMANETTFSVTNMSATDQLSLTYTITLG
jgi:hypothetical protein